MYLLFIKLYLYINKKKKCNYRFACDHDNINKEGKQTAINKKISNSGSSIITKLMSKRFFIHIFLLIRRLHSQGVVVVGVDR